MSIAEQAIGAVPLPLVESHFLALPKPQKLAFGLCNTQPYALRTATLRLKTGGYLFAPMVGLGSPFDIDRLPFELIGQRMRKMSAQDWINHYESTLKK